MHEEILSWPSIDVFYTSSDPVNEGEAMRVWCTRVKAPYENIPAIAEHYRWHVIGMVAM